MGDHIKRQAKSILLGGDNETYDCLQSYIIAQDEKGQDTTYWLVYCGRN